MDGYVFTVFFGNHNHLFYYFRGGFPSGNITRKNNG